MQFLTDNYSNNYPTFHCGSFSLPNDWARCWHIFVSSSNPHQAILDALGVQLLTRPANKSYFSIFPVPERWYSGQEVILDIPLAISFTT